MINLVETPAALAPGQDSESDIGFVAIRQGVGGSYGRALSGGCQIALLGGARPERPLAAVIPLDGMARDRLSAVERFIRAQSGRSVQDWRLTQAQRRRLTLMLRALDGRAAGASYLDLALALFGRRLVDPAHWHDSSFRFTTLRLVRDGLKMVDGGYRQLLRSRRQT